MDANAVFYSILLSAAFGLAGYNIGRLQRALRKRREVQANLARANERSKQRANAVRHAVTLPDDDDDTGTDTGPDSDSHDYGDTGPGSGIGEAGRGTIHRDHNGPRSYSRPARGARRRTNEAALVE